MLRKRGGPDATAREGFHFGPLAGYGTEELDRRGLDQDKKNIKNYKWASEKDKSFDSVHFDVEPEMDPDPGERKRHDVQWISATDLFSLVDNEPLNYQSSGPLSEASGQSEDRRTSTRRSRPSGPSRTLSASFRAPGPQRTQPRPTRPALTRRQRIYLRGLPPLEGKNGDQAPTWHEFIRKTSLHGIKYIFRQTAYKARR